MNMTKVEFDFLVKNGLRFRHQEYDVVKSLVNDLIQALYIPTLDKINTHRDPVRCKQFGIDEEAINWGDLKCYQVERFESGEFLISIDEADPNCPTFCGYIRKYMESWGWKVRVQTEW